MPNELQKKASHLEAQLAIQSKNFASVLSDLQGKSTELEDIRKFAQREVSTREKAELRLGEAELLTKKALREAREAESLLEQANEKHDSEVRGQARPAEEQPSALLFRVRPNVLTCPSLGA